MKNKYTRVVSFLEAQGLKTMTEAFKRSRVDLEVKFNDEFEKWTATITSDERDLTELTKKNVNSWFDMIA